ncbi:MAG: hypothetical protein A3H31_07325 [Gallionellales bacterium RIFCSPLOWO2_02_FULL_57_47]|nr:MAG: hypothetical protein A3H31_07325 [Gallionellales bacterium RIFCSPLOWO2_02_FULL_57_47]OGT12779.1 MAG: hypothetical protein A3J49_08940 [Gallionellales bacterium RIFCSPHIGHO2_02_FULL_57_16]
MRIKSNWFKNGRKRTPQEIAGALAFVIWRIGDNALKNTRNAKFEIAIGTQYFSFLGEFLIFLIQVADRIAYRQLSAEDRMAFTSALANRVAETLAENQSRLIGNSIEKHKQYFIDMLNQRAGEYADFKYNNNGPDFAFTRYLGYCMREVMDEKDAAWVIDQMMGIEAPEAVTMVEKTMHDLFETEPRQPRSRKTVSGD